MKFLITIVSLYFIRGDYSILGTFYSGKDDLSKVANDAIRENLFKIFEDVSFVAISKAEDDQNKSKLFVGFSGFHFCSLGVSKENQLNREEVTLKKSNFTDSSTYAIFNLLYGSLDRSFLETNPTVFITFDRSHQYPAAFNKSMLNEKLPAYKRMINMIFQRKLTINHVPFELLSHVFEKDQNVLKMELNGYDVYVNVESLDFTRGRHRILYSKINSIKQSIIGNNYMCNNNTDNLMIAILSKIKDSALENYKVEDISAIMNYLTKKVGFKKYYKHLIAKRWGKTDKITVKNRYMKAKYKFKGNLNLPIDLKGLIKYIPENDKPFLIIMLGFLMKNFDILIKIVLSKNMSHYDPIEVLEQSLRSEFFDYCDTTSIEMLNYLQCNESSNEDQFKSLKDSNGAIKEVFQRLKEELKAYAISKISQENTIPSYILSDLNREYLKRLYYEAKQLK
ncbi:hypothetical protein NGRA_0700 [Nosema granulosis]|uniref:Uncharacterized protein n=1 Tax=Nosema granulosis TaxID=83296 RepID=A0A9P6GZV8_9MICR|nr:hypothetical protein NGRA_0700 [Nosema granulosis]